MANEVKDGGPAFPAEWAPHGKDFSQGMSLRDYFAAKAMEALLSDWKVSQRICEAQDYDPDGKGGRDFKALIADNAYHFADAMLARRAKGAGP